MTTPRRTLADRELWRAANLLIDRHGRNATLAAEEQIDVMRARGDVERQVTWQYILAAINDLQQARPAMSECHHGWPC